MFSKTAFELLPEDLQRHISGYLTYKYVLELQKVAKNFYHVKQCIREICLRIHDVSENSIKQITLNLPMSLRVLRLTNSDLYGHAGAYVVLNICKYFPTYTYKSVQKIFLNNAVIPRERIFKISTMDNDKFANIMNKINKRIQDEEDGYHEHVCTMGMGWDYNN